jgi:hypothetical protein
VEHFAVDAELVGPRYAARCPRPHGGPDRHRGAAA